MREPARRWAEAGWEPWKAVDCGRAGPWTGAPSKSAHVCSVQKAGIVRSHGSSWNVLSKKGSSRAPRVELRLPLVSCKVST